MAEQNKQEWVLCEFTKIAPSFEKVEENLKEKGVIITPSDYIKACKTNGLIPDIHQTFVKIDESTATLEDVNLILCDVGSAVQERILRRIRKNPTEKHITHGGHQKLGGPNLAGRTTPKRKRSGHTQSHGRGEHAHDRSTKTQRRSARSVDESGSGVGTEPTTDNSTT
jgi:hypothetical protein